MKCDFDYCIYNQESLCILKETQINSLGMCEECVIISIIDEDLREIKEKQLKGI